MYQQSIEHACCATFSKVTKTLHTARSRLIVLYVKCYTAHPQNIHTQNCKRSTRSNHYAEYLYNKILK